ncbi:Excitatory amino acid transporter 5 [Labeo rohita]|uniref:Amino acid transporter n=1 Tax=Labeo rohita TaxID=84645 RepID=A0ABQ8MXZ2_LABRO|nr:Excitatory amino acid transporter 5 [Labeo rohita]
MRTGAARAGVFPVPFPSSEPLQKHGGIFQEPYQELSISKVSRMGKGLLQKERLAHLISVSSYVGLCGGIHVKKLEFVNTGKNLLFFSWRTSNENVENVDSSSHHIQASGRLGLLTITYYLWTTFIAVIVGIILVLIIHPGTGTEKEGHKASGGPVMTSADALLDLIRNMIPSNLIEATFQQYKTELVPNFKNSAKSSQANFVYIMPDYENPNMGHPVFLELTPPPEIHYKIVPGKSNGMNVLGIVIFSATMGIINAAMWYFPFGIVFLVAGKILDMHDPAVLAEKLGMYFMTVLAGLFVHGVILLPMFFFLFTRKNPFSYIRGLLQALVIALATSSSSATLPITMKCLLENCHVDRKIARFVLPVGATINMDGTALYEAVAAIFIAQVNEYELDFGQLVTIRDRFRTMINVLGDALAAGIMAHLDTVISFGNQSVQSLPTSEVPLLANRDYILEVVGDQVIERPTTCYNLCQV